MSARRLTLRTLVSLCAVTGGLLFMWSAPALAQRDHVFSTTFGSEGSGDGQFSRPGALAVNDVTGDVYVVDRGNGRVEIFSSTGAYVGQFNGSASPTGAFSWPALGGTPATAPEGGVAVDNSTNPLDPSAGDVYVMDTGHGVIDKFSASGVYLGQITGLSATSPFRDQPGTEGGVVGLNDIAVGPDGALWVQIEDSGLPSLYEFSDALANEYVATITPKFPRSSRRTTLGRIGMALDSEGNIYIGHREFLENYEIVGKFTAAAVFLAEELDSEETTGVAVDLSSNDVYIDNQASVAAFTPSGTPIERFGSEQMQASTGIAVSSSTGTVYTSNPIGQVVDVFSAVVVPDVTTGSVSNFGETSVTVGGVVDPDRVPVTSCVFEYGTTTSYGQSAPCEQAPAQIGSGSGPVAVSANLTGLERLTGYHFRLKVSNANGANEGRDRTFVTPEPVGISEEGVSDVSSTSALFSAQVDPGGSDTTFHFEYGTSIAYGESMPVPEGDAGSVTSAELVSVSSQDLLPDTEYHVRLVASNALGTVFGPDETFTTQEGGGAFVLPDGREWEMVSPPDKYGAAIEPIEDGVVEAAEDGSAITYRANGPFVASSAGNPSPGKASQVLSSRSSSGWSSEDIVTPQQALTSAGEEGMEYSFFSSDLSRAVVEPFGPTPLSPETSEKTLYLRDDSTGSYLPLVSAGNVPAGTQFGGKVFPIVGTPDLSHVLLRSEDKTALTSTPVTAEQNLYEWSDGRLQLVNVLEDGTVSKFAKVGEGEYNTRNALSSDGSVVFWQANTGGSEHDSLYMRDMVTGKTVRVDAPAPGVSPSPTPRARFQIASTDGSDVFFLDEDPLTTDSKLSPPEQNETTGSNDLYVYDTITGTLTDLTADTSGSELAYVRGTVLGASEDGSIVYFVASGVLAGEGEAGKDNLYLAYETGSTWSTRLIAVLSASDKNDWGSGGEEESPFVTNPAEMTARVSPNGRYLAFMSQRSLTGYDNHDANSGEPDAEVFLYDESTNHLACVSCNPTGARPTGVFDEGPEELSKRLLSDRKRVLKGHWLAADIIPWEWASETYPVVIDYQPRYLSDEGRLFFNSFDSLVPQATNGKANVYEYEPAGLPADSRDTCTASSATYSSKSGGCVGLISSGTSGEESTFLDASGMGPGGEESEDVFFLTESRLVPQDVETSFNVYDAHVCSSAAPCVTTPVSPPPCSSGDACKAAPSPQPAIFGAPSSATFSGAGNVAPAAPVKSASTPKKGTKKKKKGKKKSSSRGKPKSSGRGGGSRARKSLSARTGR